MNTLITPAEILDSAFSPEELYDVMVITPTDIATAEERYLIPIVGRELYDALLAGEYESLRINYVLPAVAAWTRRIIEPLLASRCGICHDHQPTAAEAEVLRERCRSLGLKARTLSRRLAKQLNATADDYPEYDPMRNSLNRCSLDGDIVQVR